MEYYKNLSLEDLFYINDYGLVCCEEWYDIPNYEGCYKLSSLYRVKSIERFANVRGGGIRIVNDRILKPYINKRTTHLSVLLSKKGVTECLGIHVIVARVHIPNPLNLPIVEHLNDIPTDNRPENLMWSTIAQNTRHAFERNRFPSRKGENNNKSKLKDADILYIRASELDNSAIGRIYGVSNQIISSIRLRKKWSHI